MRKTPKAKPGHTIRFELDGRSFVGVVQARRKSKLTVLSHGHLVVIDQQDITGIDRRSLK